MPAAREDAGAPPQLDADRLAEIRLLESMGVPDVLARVARQFLKSSSALIVAIEAARAARDREQMCRGLHNLKGISASIGADGLARRCAELEERARCSVFDEAEAAELNGECARVQAAVRALFESADGPG